MLRAALACERDRTAAAVSSATPAPAPVPLARDTVVAHRPIPTPTPAPAPLARDAVVAHRLIPTLAPWRHCVGLGDDDSAWLSAAAAGHALRGLAGAATLLDVHAAMAKAGVRALVLKGLPLAVRTTGRLDGRQYDDVDVLVSPADLGGADAALRAGGLTPAGVLRSSPLGGPHRRWAGVVTDHSLAYRRRDGLPVELHWRLTSTGLLKLDFEEMWRRRHTVTVGDEEVAAPGAVHELVFDAVHGAVHGFARLSWLVDIVRLLRTTSDHDWAQAIRLARRLGVLRPLAMAVTLAATLEDHGRAVPLGRRQRCLVDRLSNEDWTLPSGGAGTGGAGTGGAGTGAPSAPGEGAAVPLWQPEQWGVVRRQLLLSAAPRHKLAVVAATTWPLALLEESGGLGWAAWVRVPLRSLVPLRTRSPQSRQAS